MKRTEAVMRFAFFLSLSFFLLGTSFGMAEENWPQFRGSTGDGHSSSGDLPITWSEKENIVWKTAIHSRGWSSPVVWGDQIWLTTASANGKKMFFVCVSRETGKIIYDKKIFDVVKPREIHKLNSYASPSPVIEQGRVYVLFGSYGTACIDTTTGETLWTRRDLECDHFRGPGSSPILVGDLLIAHYDGADFQYVVALDKKTGKTIWKTKRTNDYKTDNGDFKKAFSTPSLFHINGKQRLISIGAKSVFAYDPLTGKEFWQVNFLEHSGTVRPLFGEGLIYITTGFGKAQLLAITPSGKGNVTESHIKWRTPKNAPSKPSMLLIDGLLYMVSDRGIMTCLDAKTGKQIWTKRLRGNFSASPIYADGRIYLSNQEGTTTVLKPGKKYQLLAENKLESVFMASAAVSGKAIILRTEKHLYRIEKK